ncbi:hypothetical protein [Phenylobacterium sp.]|uniref:hypothetical protein n=1 Tax=Phenylobacterium sp. TaxID=1871053 RepID=UPI0012076B2F|nr:hypothetical protein [Phenylobacterium sp.]THD61024.1 MAG: hypothetical protein E8A49_12205 [Phenylobacterium sp.]
MRETLAVADDEPQHALCALTADVEASLALSRAVLLALAALSPAAGEAAEAALETEAERAQGRAAPQRTLDVVEDARARLQRAPVEARMGRALQQALVTAAEALPERSADRRVA